MDLDRRERYLSVNECFQAAYAAAVPEVDVTEAPNIPAELPSVGITDAR